MISLPREDSRFMPKKFRTAGHHEGLVRLSVGI